MTHCNPSPLLSPIRHHPMPRLSFPLIVEKGKGNSQFSFSHPSRVHIWRGGWRWSQVFGTPCATPSRERAVRRQEFLAPYFEIGGAVAVRGYSTSPVTSLFDHCRPLLGRFQFVLVRGWPRFRSALGHTPGRCIRGRVLRQHFPGYSWPRVRCGLWQS